MRRGRGFTLLEVLLALALLAVLVALLWGALAAATRGVRNGESRLTAAADVRAAQAFLRRELAAALPLPWGRDHAQLPLVFEGEPQRMRFVGTLPAFLGGRGPLRLELSVDPPAAGRRALRLRFQTLASARAGAQDWGDAETLLGHLRDGHFAYRGLDAEGRPTAWLPRWPWPQRLPLLVRIELDGGTDWPPLVIAPRLDPGANNIGMMGAAYGAGSP